MEEGEEGFFFLGKWRVWGCMLRNLQGGWEGEIFRVSSVVGGRLSLFQRRGEDVDWRVHEFLKLGIYGNDDVRRKIVLRRVVNLILWGEKVRFLKCRWRKIKSVPAGMLIRELAQGVHHRSCE